MASRGMSRIGAVIYGMAGKARTGAATRVQAMYVKAG